MKEYFVDVSGVATWSEFLTAVNEGFVRQIDGDWKGNMDAFNDYLYWPEEHPYRLVFRGWENCKPMLSQRRSGDGKTILEGMSEIFRESPQVEVVFSV